MDISDTAVKVTRGGKNPLLVENTSSFAEALGVVVPIPVWARILVDNNKKRIVIFFIAFSILTILIVSQNPLAFSLMLQALLAETESLLKIGHAKLDS